MLLLLNSLRSANHTTTTTTNPILVDPVEEEAVSVNFQRDWNANASVLRGSYSNRYQ